MNHVNVRRIALSFAAISFGSLFLLVLICSASAGLYPTDEAADVAVLEEVPVRNGISFPILVDGTCLIAQNIAAYDGPFIEDGSGREVFDVMALVLVNNSDEFIEYAHISLEAASQVYHFEAMLLLPGSKVLVLEREAKLYREQPILSCTGFAVRGGDQDPLPVTVTSVEKNKLCIQNLSKNDLFDLTVYHKTYLPDVKMYMGGRPFETKISCISAESTVEITPENYVTGYSKVICIKNYEVRNGAHLIVYGSITVSSMGQS